ncbi:hypothetical protein CJU72_12355 [Pseudomonas fragi]|nr:hypothetical protein CJU72_12355 [Pseudomonas fragi]
MHDCYFEQTNKTLTNFLFGAEVVVRERLFWAIVDGEDDPQLTTGIASFDESNRLRKFYF